MDTASTIQMTMDMYDIMICYGSRDKLIQYMESHLDEGEVLNA